MNKIEHFLYKLFPNYGRWRFKFLVRIDSIRHRFGLYGKERKRFWQEATGEIPLHIPIWHRTFIPKEQLQELFELEKSRKRYRENVRDFQDSLKAKKRHATRKSDYTDSALNIPTTRNPKGLRA